MIHILCKGRSLCFLFCVKHVTLKQEAAIKVEIKKYKCIKREKLQKDYLLVVSYRSPISIHKQRMLICSANEQQSVSVRIDVQ